MKIELRKLSVTDGKDIYDMLQEIPSSESGYGNSMNGAAFDEYKN